MDPKHLVQAAKDAIGKGESDDYVLAPTKHTAQLGAEAAPLVTVLQASEVSTVARQYEERDREAGQAQLLFKKTANRANWAVLLAASFTALLLMTAPVAVLSTDSTGKWLQLLLGACGLLSGVAGSFWLSTIREGKLLARWMGARAAAETRRIRYFDLVTGLTGDAQKGSIPLPLLQLEYFRRYQLDVQMAYYRGRGVDHERTADKLLTLSALAVGLGSFATGIAALLGSAVSPHWVSIAGLGAIAAALSAFASSREAVGQNRRNMERYRRTLEALESLSGKLDDVGMAAAMGEREPLERFVAAVHEQVSLEHRQWLEAAEDTMASVGRLEESLAKLRAKRPQTAWEETSPARSAAGSQS